MQRTTMAFPRIRESRGPVYGSGPSGRKHPAIRRERTPGELALGDLRPSSDAESASRTLARYAAIRFAWLALERAPMLDDERTAAAEYTAFAAQILDASSRASLQRLLELGADSPPLEDPIRQPDEIVPPTPDIDEPDRGPIETPPPPD